MQQLLRSWRLQRTPQSTPLQPLQLLAPSHKAPMPAAPEGLVLHPAGRAEATAKAVWAGVAACTEVWTLDPVAAETAAGASLLRLASLLSTLPLARPLTLVQQETTAAARVVEATVWRWRCCCCSSPRHRWALPVTL